MQASWMHFVDGDVNMQMIGVGMNCRNPLVIGITDCRAKFVLDGVQHFKRWLFTGRERINKMVGFI
ncbi:hypothetical protein B382_24203 [Stutzerimonas stutzeri B1SMN1]|nr:hypothetical protein B382_24203 [Stutzerimonas stutzeri B1SMN1]